MFSSLSSSRSNSLWTGSIAVKTRRVKRNEMPRRHRRHMMMIHHQQPQCTVSFLFFSFVFSAAHWALHDGTRSTRPADKMSIKSGTVGSCCLFKTCLIFVTFSVLCKLSSRVHRRSVDLLLSAIRLHDVSLTTIHCFTVLSRYVSSLPHFLSPRGSVHIWLTVFILWWGTWHRVMFRDTNVSEQSGQSSLLWFELNVSKQNQNSPERSCVQCLERCPVSVAFKHSCLFVMRLCYSSTV